MAYKDVMQYCKFVALLFFFLVLKEEIFGRNYFFTHLKNYYLRYFIDKITVCTKKLSDTCNSIQVQE